MEVVFEKATYRNRIFAYALDFFLFIVTALFLMIGSNAIVRNQSFYKEANTAINNFELSAHLYALRTDGNAQLMCDYYDIKEEEDYKKYSEKFDQALTEFFTDPAFFASSEEGLKAYNLLKIPEGESQSELFIYSDSTHTSIIAKDTASYQDLYKFYSDVMSKEASKYVTSNEKYIKNSQTIMKMPKLNCII